MMAPRQSAILVVDDEPTLRKTITRLLEHAGYRVRTAACGEEAVALAAAEPFDAAICDLRLAGESGARVCERLWTVAPELAGRTLIMSGELPTPEMDRLVERAGLPPMMKPFTRNELILALTPICPPPGRPDHVREAS